MNFSSSPRARRITVCLAATLSLAVSSSGAVGSSAAALDAAAIRNFHKVNEQVYRGAQPTDLEFASLAKLGIKTVIDLCQIGEHSQATEQRLVEAAGMRYVSVPMKGMSAPADESIAKVLALLTDTAAGPVFVHCRRGADRTGTVIAVYRMQHDRWENDKALGEARSLGMSWIEQAMQHYIMRYQAPQIAGNISPSMASSSPAGDAIPAAPVLQ